MSYHEFITVRMGGAMRADLFALAVTRQTDVGKLVRQLIARELAGAHDRTAEAYDQILYLAIAMDGLLGAHPDRDLRPKLLRIWQDRLAEEGRSGEA